MTDEKSLYELDNEELLRRRVQYYQNKIKEYRAEIKKTEELLETIVTKKYLAPSTSGLLWKAGVSLAQRLAAELGFSTTTWRPKVFNYLFENPGRYTSEQILVGIDTDKAYQQNNADRKKAIKAISSSLFQLHQSNKIEKHANEGRRGWKWSIKEPVPSQETGTG